MNFTALLLIFGFVRHSFNWFVVVIYVCSQVGTCLLSLYTEESDSKKMKELMRGKKAGRACRGCGISLLSVLFLFLLMNWHNHHQETSAKSFLFQMEKQKGNYGMSLSQGFVTASEKGFYFTRFN